MKSPLKNFLVIFSIFVLILVVLSFIENPIAEKEKVGIEVFLSQLEKSEVKEVEIEEGTKLLVTLKNEKKEETFKEAVISLPELVTQYGIDIAKLRDVKVTAKAPSGKFFYNIFLPLFPIVIIGFFLFMMMRQVQGVNNKAMSFGQSTGDDGKKKKEDKITFTEVAGAKEAKEELHEIVEFLKEPKKFADMGAKLPKGALLVGAPGTGKTLLARAVAGEAEVPFFHISGSEFVEMFVGVGAARVRSLFQKAKKAAPCIIFIDEIDAVGRQRGAGLGGSHDEREQTLNQILVEMDGFDPHLGVIVLAATNRPDVLDPALLRPGRFDRRIVVDLPDIRDREDILCIHSKNKKLASDVDLHLVAQRTPGFSGADLASVVNEAAILAVRKGSSEIYAQDFFMSIEKVLLGPERKSRIMSEKERKITAYHEAAHALLAHLLPYADPVHKISIISRGMAGGYTMNLPDEDRNFHTRNQFFDQIAVTMGGFVVEQEILNGDLSTGPSDDLKKATRLATQLVTQFGMSDTLGPRVYGSREELVFLGREIHERRDYSEDVAKTIDIEISRILMEAKERAKKIIESHRDKLETIVDTLLEKETLEKDEFAQAVGIPKVFPPSLA